MDTSGKPKFKLVVDLSEITINDKFPIPNMYEILGKLGKCQYFTTTDLAKCFHQKQHFRHSHAIWFKKLPNRFLTLHEFRPKGPL